MIASGQAYKLDLHNNTKLCICTYVGVYVQYQIHWKVYVTS